MGPHKLIFMHIPKTGGETFTNEIITRGVPRDRLLSGLRGTSDYDSFVAMPLQDKEKLACVSGHLYFGVHDLFDSPCKYLTYVRDPVERVISTYYFTRRAKDTPRHEQARNCSLMDFVRDPDDLELSDYQVRLLGGNPVDPVGPAELERAKANIAEHFLCVGLTERFDASLLLMAKLLGFTHIHYKRWNVSLNKNLDQVGDLDQVREVIRERNQLDTQLYEFCAQRLEAQLAAHGVDQASVMQYLMDNVAYREKIIDQVQEEINQRLGAWEQEMERRQLAHDQMVAEFNQLTLVKLIRRLKVFGRA